MTSRKSGKTKFLASKMGRPSKPKFRHNKPKVNVDQKGFWPTHQFIRKDDSVAERNIKKGLCPSSGIKADAIDDMITGRLSTEEELLRRESVGDKLNSVDRLRIQNIKEQRIRDIERDISAVTKSRFNSKPITREGRFMVKMLWLERFLAKNNTVKLAHMYLKFQDDNDDIDSMQLPTEMKEEYSNTMNTLNKIISKVDMIDMQLNQLSTSVTPLNYTGFRKLEDFQVRVIQLIQENETKPIKERSSILVKAPTSAGKTALAGYLFTKKGRFLVSVPTNALAWQLSAYISDIMGQEVPLITDTYQSALKTADLVEKIKSSRCVVGTPKELVDIIALPDFKTKPSEGKTGVEDEPFFDWMLLDEIHMLGKREGAEMEHLIKAFPDTPVLALSATIGNEEELACWMKNCGRHHVETVVYDKRFINLQRFNFNMSTKSLDRINPLSMISLDDYRSGEVLKKSIIPTPQDAYLIYQKLVSNYPDEESIKHTSFFTDPHKRLSLDDIMSFFNHHLKFMKQRVDINDETMINMIEEFQLSDFEESDVNLVDMLFTLKEEKKCPAIVFHKNSSVIMEYAYMIHNEITRREDIKYPNMMKEREKNNKRFKQQQKKDDKDEVMKRINDSTKSSDKIQAKMDKKLSELEAEGKAEERYEEKDLFQPHNDFILTEHQYNSKAIVEYWEATVNPNRDKFFPRSGDCWHWVLMLLYRGIGIYTKGMPDPYLRIVQQMANDKQLAVVLSDKELVFGVSMPFRTAVILNDDSLDSMEYHQMAGRAGRRGLDKEGNVVFVGQSSERIRDLSVSIIPNVEGSTDCLHYGMKIIKKLSESDRWDNINKNMLVCHDKDSTDVDEFFEDVTENQSEGGVWDYVEKIENKHLLHLMWQFRQTDEAIMLPNILETFEDGFATARSTDEMDQISAAHFLLHFIECYEEEGDNKMPIHPLLEKRYSEFYKSMKDDEEGYAFDIPEEINGDLYKCILENRCLPNLSLMEKHRLRERISRFIGKLRAIQHYYYHMGSMESSDKSKYINICKLLGKLFTRMKWIYHTSSKLSEK